MIEFTTFHLQALNECQITHLLDLLGDSLFSKRSRKQQHIFPDFFADFQNTIFALILYPTSKALSAILNRIDIQAEITISIFSLPPYSCCGGK